MYSKNTDDTFEPVLGVKLAYIGVHLHNQMYVVVNRWCGNDKHVCIYFNMQFV